MSLFSVSTAVALTAATPKTAIRIMTPSSRKITIREIEVVDREAAPTDTGVLVRVLRGGTDGTGTAVTPTPLGGANACLSTAKTDYSVEPTGSPTELLVLGVTAGGGNTKKFTPAGYSQASDEGLEIPHSSAAAFVLSAPEARAAGFVVLTVTFEE